MHPPLDNVTVWTRANEGMNGTCALSSLTKNWQLSMFTRTIMGCIPVHRCSALIEVDFPIENIVLNASFSVFSIGAIVETGGAAIRDIPYSNLDCTNDLIAMMLDEGSHPAPFIPACRKR